jgi:Holliday junction DNA helicase RuvA
MIASLRGVLVEKHPNQVIVECHGVGYDVTIPVSTFSSLPEVNREVTLRIHTHVREDALALFGFLTTNEKLLFEKLTGVSGIGPKLAITVLSGLPVSDLVGAIRGGAIEVLVKVPGIGKKTAERIVLELKDKLELLLGAAGSPSQIGAAKPKSAFSQAEEDVISALINFGSNRASSEAAILKAKQEGSGQEDFEALFRRALKLVR